ncbi:conserved hypothetical protein [Ricinus communis]|uniref:Secreted protein n=1 Tax=Ricinus communis TaxID=3988 RepID=B9RMG1_RICCO|nr:conserved hypothetical protein [Ricinus communis]
MAATLFLPCFLSCVNNMATFLLWRSRVEVDGEIGYWLLGILTGPTMAEEFSSADSLVSQLRRPPGSADFGWISSSGCAWDKYKSTSRRKKTDMMEARHTVL